MAQNYFACPNCGAVDLLTYTVQDMADPSRWPPICSTPECFEQRMELAPQPGDFAMDVGGVKGAAFQKFDVDVDGHPVTIDSLHTLRKVERESEQRYRNGEGEPLRFRMWNNDRSNRDVSSFGEKGEIGVGTVKRSYDSGTPLKKSGKISVTRHGEEKPTIKVAKGGGTTALGHG